MKVQTYINEGPGIFWKYQPGDKLVLGPLLEISRESQLSSNITAKREVSDLVIAERVWEVGNRMAPDADGEEWPSWIRSLSMGDVIVIGETAYTCVSVGWEPISTEALTWSLDPDRQNRNIELEAARRG